MTAEITPMSTDLKQLSQCVLSPELAVLAAKELNESPQRRSQALTELRARLRERRDEGDGAQSDSFLLRFLRCKKFDVDRSLCVYERYHTFRQENPGMFAGLSANGVRHIWEAGLLGGLQERDRQGRAVMVAFPGRWDPEQHSLEDVLRALILQLEYLIQSNETQVTGIVLIVDFTDFSFYLARSVRPWYFQLMTALVQNAFPARFKGVYLLNQPWYISVFLTILKRLLSEKMNSRMHLLGDNIDMLNEDFDVSLLPSELGGSRGPYDPTQWIETMLQADKQEQPTNQITSLPIVSSATT